MAEINYRGMSSDKPEPSNIKRVRKFVKKHRFTLVCCGVTAVVSSRVGSNLALKGANNAFREIVVPMTDNLVEMTKVVTDRKIQDLDYELEHLNLIGFVEHNGLRDQFFSFAKKANENIG